MVLNRCKDQCTPLAQKIGINTLEFYLSNNLEICARSPSPMASLTENLENG